MDKIIKDSFVRQNEQKDCGVACLLSVIRFYGGDNTIENLRMLSGTSRTGTTLLGLYQTANSLDFTCEGNKSSIKSLIEHNRPTILHIITENKIQHYIVFYGFEKDYFIIGDPAKGVDKLTKDELERLWVTKTCLTLKPKKDFLKIKNKHKFKQEWFFRLIKDDKRIIMPSLLLGIIIAVLGTAMTIFSQKLIDDILPEKKLNKLVTGIILVTILLIIRSGLIYLRDYLIIKQSRNFNIRIIDSFFGSLLQLSKSFFDNRKIGDLVARLNDTQRIQKVIKLVIGNVVINFLISVSLIVVLFYYSWEIGLISLFVIPFYFILIYRFNSSIIASQNEIMNNYGITESNFINSVSNISTIKVNNRESIFRNLNLNVYSVYQNSIFNFGKINLKISLLSEIFNIFFLVIILSFTSYKVYHNYLDYGELTAILGASASLLPSIATIALISIPIHEANVAFNRMYEFASAKKEKITEKTINEFNSLKIKKMSFRFPGRKKLLDNINIEISQNECISIIGESGSGKSTIVEILQKFYPYEEGEVLINGSIDLKEINSINWRSFIGVVPQEITIFNGTLLDNILLGEEENVKNVVSFLKKFNFEGFLEKFPLGLMTILGENGINLSGGEKQIVALIRALYNKPKLLILDEFNSSIDRETEIFVIKLLIEIKKNTSIILISHRLYDLDKLTDNIYILEGGSVSFYGSPRELLKFENFYSNSVLHKN